MICPRRFRFRVNAAAQANRGQSWTQRCAANTAEALPGCWLHLGYIRVAEMSRYSFAKRNREVPSSGFPSRSSRVRGPSSAPGKETSSQAQPVPVCPLNRTLRGATVPARLRVTNG
jgi:hypothetical protein